MSKWFRRAGDINDNIDAVLTGVADLTGATVVAVVSHTTQPPVTLSGAIVSAVDRSVSIDLGDNTGWLATVAIAGESYEVEFRVTWPDTTKLTWPSNNIPDRIVVT